MQESCPSIQTFVVNREHVAFIRPPQPERLSVEITSQSRKKSKSSTFDSPEVVLQFDVLNSFFTAKSLEFPLARGRWRSCTVKSQICSGPCPARRAN